MDHEQNPEDTLPDTMVRFYKWLLLALFGIMFALFAYDQMIQVPRHAAKKAEEAKWVANALPQHMQDELKSAVDEEKEYRNWQSQEAVRHAKAVKTARCKANVDTYADDLNRCGVRASQAGMDPLVACAHILNRFTGEAIQGRFSNC